MTREEKAEALETVAKQELPVVIQASDLYKTAIQAVPGDGNPDAEIVIIGEAPGKKEDELGKPFVGASGKLLNELLASIGMKREDIFIANVIKHRPPDNRDPSKEEIEIYTPWLEKQLDIIDPKIVITLGRFSMDFMLGKGFSISEIHGQPQEKNGRIIVPLYHPAAAMYSGKLRPVLFADFSKIPNIIKQAKN